MLSSPTLLTKNHQLDTFACGVDSLDEWLKKRAFSNQVNGASRTYVVADEQKAVGYYYLASGALELNNAPSSSRRTMPNPIPVVILGRLAIDKTYQGKGIGVALLQDAILRTAQAAGILGIRGLLVHALSAEAKVFYEHHGFVVSPTQPMTLILSLKNLLPEVNL